METPAPAPRPPAFWEQVTNYYRDGISHAFILHGNVRDYVDGAGYLKLPRFLAVALSRRSDLIIQVDPELGLDFPMPAHRDLLVKLVANPGAPAVPLVQALRQNGAIQRSPAMLSLKDVSALLAWLLTEALQIRPEGEKKDRPLRVAIIFDFAEFILPETELSRTDMAVLTRFIKWAQSPTVGENHLLMICAESLPAIHSELRRASGRWEAIEMPLPTSEARERFVAAKLEQDTGLDLGPELTPRLVAQMTGGLSLIQIEDILFRGAGAGGLSRTLITERKQAIISQEFADVLTISDARFDLNQVGGYDYLKDWLAKRIIRPWQASSLRVGGLLMSGPPGTGKTMLAEALAGSALVPFVVFRLSKILGQYVGNSERALDRALHAIMSLAPVLVFIDELDQNIRRGEHGDTSGVDNRIFSRLLEFMEDPARRGKVLIVAATNRPDLLDVALRSRFDRTIPVLPPAEPADRAAILITQARSHGIALRPTEQALARTEGWTGRHIRDFMEVVAELVHDDGLPAEQALAEAFELYVPRLHDVHEMTRLALQEITDLRLVPPAFRQTLGDQPPATEAAPGAAEPRRRGRREL